MVSPGGDASPKPYLLDDSSQLALDLQAEALNVPDEEFPVLALQGDMAGGWHGSLPPLLPELNPALPSPAHLHRRSQQQTKDAFQLLHGLFCRAQATRG